MPALRRPLATAALAVLLALGLRLAHAGEVFGGSTVGLGPDGDPLYHVLQAERISRGAPGAPWTDASLDWPHGAPVPWPPLFDAGLAFAARLVHGPDATREQVAAVAALAPPLLGVLSVLLAGALAARLFGRGGALASLLLAGLMASGETTVVGRADQHALEVVLAPALWLAFAAALGGERPRRRRAALALALLTALAFWGWMGSAFLLALPVMGALLLHLLDREEAEAGAMALALGAGGGAALLLLSLLALGPPGALLRTSAVGLTGLHVAIAVGCALVGAGLLLARRLRPAGGTDAPPSPASPARRAIEAALALLLPLAGLLLGVPPLRAGAAAGLTALAASGAWYADISEFAPLVGTGRAPLLVELRHAFALFGLVPPLALAGAILLWRRRPDGGRLGGLVAVGLAWTAALAALALARYRFVPYAALLLVGPAAVALEAGADRLAERLRRPRLALLGLGLCVALTVAPSAAEWEAPPGRTDPALVALLDGLARLPPRADGRDGVAAPWELGHAIQYYGRHPALATPFGLEAGAATLPDLAAFLHATREEEAAAVLARRRVGYALLGEPTPMALNVRGFAPPGAPQAVRAAEDLLEGWQVELLPGALELFSTQLYAADGAAMPPDRPAAATFRLLGEAGAEERPVKLFGVVAGALLEVSGARPGAPVTARLQVTIRRRSFGWAAGALADAGGRARLRVPYATGRNGAALAGPVEVGDGLSAATVSLGEATVLGGGAVAVSLTPEAPPAKSPRPAR